MKCKAITQKKVTLSSQPLLSSTQTNFRMRFSLNNKSKGIKNNINVHQVLVNKRYFSKEQKRELPFIKQTSNTPQITSASTYFSNKTKIKQTFYYVVKPENCGYLIKKCLEHRLNWKETTENSFVKFNFKWQQCNNGINFGSLSKFGSHKQMVNHFENHYTISNKANLFENFLHYCELQDINAFKYIPITILFNYDNNNFITYYENFCTVYNQISQFICDPYEMDVMRYKVKNCYNFYFPFQDKLGSKTPIVLYNTHYAGSNIWLVKAPNLNRGRCIRLASSTEKIRKYIKNFYQGIVKGYSEEKKESEEDIYHKYKSNVIVVQKYIEKPLLYRGRKFDIRIWVLLTHKEEVYMFKEGHLKVCSVNYNVKSKDTFVHLTNYSLQKHNSNFEKFEKGNEVSYKEFQAFLDENVETTGKKVNYIEDILPKIKRIISMVFQSVKLKINGLDRKYCFEIFGFDFMIDEEYNPFLIEVNTNPGLEESSPLIKMLVPRMLDDALRLTIDDIFKTSYSFYDGDAFLEHYYPYISLFPVKGYFNTENLWTFLCDLKKDEITHRKSNFVMKARNFSTRGTRRKTFW